MSRHIEQPTEPIDAGLDRIERRIAGRRMAAELVQYIGDNNLNDPHFMASLIEVLQRTLPPEPKPEPEAPQPISRLGATRMPFGQYMGMTLDECPIDYLDWLCRNQEDFYRDLRAYLKHPDLESRRRGVDR